MEKLHLQINAIWHWLPEFKETGSVLHKIGVGRPSNLQMKSKKLFLEAHKNQNRQTFMQLGIPQTTGGLFITTFTSILTNCRLCSLKPRQ
jgi:transposase